MHQKRASATKPAHEQAELKKYIVARPHGTVLPGFAQDHRQFSTRAAKSKRGKAFTRASMKVIARAEKAFIPQSHFGHISE